MISDTLYQKLEKVIQDHIRNHQEEVSIGESILQQLNVKRLNQKNISQDYSFNLNATGEKVSINDSISFKSSVTGRKVSPNESIELTKARIEANSDWNDGWTKQYYADKVKELEDKSKYYFDYDRNDHDRKNPFPKELNLQLEQIRQEGGFEWTPGN